MRCHAFSSEQIYWAFAVTSDTQPPNNSLQPTNISAPPAAPSLWLCYPLLSEANHASTSFLPQLSLVNGP
jgi:hypothetical protein